MKFKYQVVCVSRVQNKVIITYRGEVFTNLRDARRALPELHSANAAVARLNSNENLTADLIN